MWWSWVCVYLRKRHTLPFYDATGLRRAGLPLLYISRNSAGNLRGCENLRFRKFPWKFAIAQYWLCRLDRISCARSASANHHAFASRSLFGPRTTSALLQRARRGVPSHQSLSRAPWMRAHIHIYRARRAFPVRCAPPECGGERQRLHARDHDRQRPGLSMR